MDETPLVILILLGMTKTGFVCAESVCEVSGSENKVCEYGCCGDVGSQYCCFYWKGYVVIASVVGGLILMSCIVGTIILFSCFSPMNAKTSDEEASKPTENKCKHVSISIDGAPNSRILPTECSPSAQNPYILIAPQKCNLSDVSATKTKD